MAFIFGALLEFALVNYAARKDITTSQQRMVLTCLLSTQVSSLCHISVKNAFIGHGGTHRRYLPTPTARRRPNDLLSRLSADGVEHATGPTTPNAGQPTRERQLPSILLWHFC